ncbi:MAG: DMT family transporter, partial [Burkholderiaceae bacterium]|nr:DMT family transporter [Burkholderiaceae bacterium]
MEVAPAAVPGAVARGVFSGMAAGALWGLIFLIPLLLRDFNPWQLSSARYLVYGAVALGLLLPRWGRTGGCIGGREWRALLGLSVLGNIAYYALLSIGVQWSGSAPTALIIGLIPVLVTLVGSRQRGAVGIRPLLAPMALCVLGVLAVT